MTKLSITYRDAGVDIEAGEALVDRIRPIVAKTRRSGCLGAIGGFGGLFELPLDRYREPVLVSGTDGVGTKLKLAMEADKHDTVGIDLVAMCVNDVLVQGAEPLFFLDYFACSHLDTDIAERVIAGIAEGCQQAGAALVGGETAEMPGMYTAGEYDLAGFTVGIVEKSEIINGERIRSGDQLIGLAASGLHSNGFSLVRKILDMSKTSLQEVIGGSTLADILLTPTRIYVKSLLPLLKAFDIRGMAHITGGGLPGNVVRILPRGCNADIDTTCWQWPTIFSWLQQQVEISTTEMLRTFNCGIGMVLIVPLEQSDEILHALQQSGETADVIGNVVDGEGESFVRCRN